MRLSACVCVCMCAHVCIHACVWGGGGGGCMQVSSHTRIFPRVHLHVVCFCISFHCFERHGEAGGGGGGGKRFPYVRIFLLFPPIEMHSCVLELHTRTL